MESLTRREHWDAVHVSERAEGQRPRGAARSRLGGAIKRLLGKRLVEYMANYDDYQIRDVLCRRHMPPPGASLVEIGSAPGEHLVKLSETFGLIPFGIEYSPEGVDVNRSLFRERGFDPGNVLALDFFDDQSLDRYREHFDVVVSRGFIEHFEEPEKVVDRHLDLLKPGGLLVVSIPNLRGVNHALTWLFHPELLPMHNLDIMAKGRFLGLFDPGTVRPLTCTYVGTFSFYLFNVRPGSPLGPLLRVCHKAQVVLNVLFRLCLGDHGAENRFTSPQLVFMGVKR